MNYEQREQQRKAANRSLLLIAAQIGGIALGWRNGHNRIYDPWFMMLGLGSTAVCLIVIRKLRDREVDLSLHLILAVGVGIGLGFSIGMFFGIFD